MPLTKLGMKIKGNFISEYGRKKGTRYYYAWENKHKELMKRILK